jgi:hypothetical protein
MKTELQDNIPNANMARRSFLRYAGVGAASVGLLTAAACHKDHRIQTIPNGIDIGVKGDMAILNYLYMLEQFGAAFYTQLIQSPYTDITADETAIFTSIRDHEIVHREFLKTIVGINTIPALVVDFSTIDFTSKPQVFAAAKAFKDLAVRAYSYSGYAVTTDTNVTLIAKIASVEARHSALIGNMITFGSFASNDEVDGNGLNKTSIIPEVLSSVNAYLKTKVSAVNYNYQV